MLSINGLNFSALCEAQAHAYGVSSVTEHFTVAVTLEQTLQDQITEKSDFLKSVNTALVKHGSGETVKGKATGGVTSTTDTRNGDNERKPKSALSLTASQYDCKKVNSDVSLHHDDIDSWSPKFPNFQQRFRGWVQTAIANDRQKIAFNGTHWVANSDIAAFPMMNDCGVGWLQIMRNQMPANVMSEGEMMAGEIRIGAGGDYANLDCAVHDLKQLIPEHMREGLKVLIGDELINNDKAMLYAQSGDKPSEKSLVENNAVIGRYGGLTYMTPNYFPSRAIMIVDPMNLVVNVQRGTWRKKVENNEAKECVIDWNSRRECYGISELEAVALIESDNVKIKDSQGNWV